MKRLSLTGTLLLLATGLFAQSDFWDQAVTLLGEGRVHEADVLVQAALADRPNDAEVLVVAGTVTLYQRMVPRQDESIFQPNVDPATPGEPKLDTEGAEAVAAFWKGVPAVDPARGYLWGDLAQLTYRAGDSARAIEFARSALNDPSNDPEALRSAAQVFALDLDWARASAALQKVPGERLALLYQGLDAWRTAKDGWRQPLKAYVDNHGDNKMGVALAAYLIGPAMRDTEAGYLEALKQEAGIPSLAIRQKYVDRYPDKFQPRLDLARSLSQHGNFLKALVHYSEIDRRAVAASADEKLSVLFQEAWAHQAAGHHAEAARLWGLLSTAKDFYLRSAACWFLGQEALRGGKVDEAKDWWSKVAAEPARSKYAWWAATELKALAAGPPPAP